jgi:hypothetical protein
MGHRTLNAGHAVSSALCAGIAVLALATAAARAEEQAPATPEAAPASGYTTARTGGPHDFDYFAGGWTTHQRRLKARGVGSTDWEEFPATLCMALYLDGLRPWTRSSSRPRAGRA